MRHMPIKSTLFAENRRRLTELMEPNSLAIVNAADVLPTNTDGVLPYTPGADLFYFTGIEQEQSIFLLFPDAREPKMREMLFLREPIEHLKIWEGAKLTKEQATKKSGIESVRWLEQFEGILQILMCEADHVYLNLNEHPRADLTVESRDLRMARDLRHRFPLHDYRRLGRLMHKLRAHKSPGEIELLEKAIQITDDGLRRVMKFVEPGVTEHEVEAEFAHEFTRQRATFGYPPIVASGVNNCCLHYVTNDQKLKSGQLLLMDVGACYANYNADLTRTIPVKGKYTRRQKQVYKAVLRVMRQSIENATVGKNHREWQRDAQVMINEELVRLKLITKAQAKKHTPEEPACKKYYMHGLGHHLGLGVHDLGDMADVSFQPGYVLTVEPGIYIEDEKFGVRIENDILVTESGPVDLTANIPVEPDEIEEIMQSGK